jgi:general secretion pathway protein A
LIRASQTFEELRLLLNCQMNDGFLISLILLGQLELRAKIQKVPALDQRIAVRQHLGPLDVTDTGEMLLHRLRVAGYTGELSPFSPDAVFLLHKYSGGIPRLATQLADNVLMMAFAAKQRVVDGFLMHSVICDHAGHDVTFQKEAA